MIGITGAIVGHFFFVSQCVRLFFLINPHSTLTKIRVISPIGCRATSLTSPSQAPIRFNRNRQTVTSDKTTALNSHLLHRIKSFVRREGRITQGQQRAFQQSWARFGLDISPNETIDPEQLFGRRAPLILEIGFGDGDSLATLCATNPEFNFIGIEVYRPGVGHLLLRATELALSNLRIVCADAVELLEYDLPDSCLDRIQIYFPDPWPKLRHHKRRLIQPAFAALLARKLKPGGQLHIATDCESYARSTLGTLSAVPEFNKREDHGGFLGRPFTRPSTKYERRAKRSGQTVWELLFVKRPG